MVESVEFVHDGMTVRGCLALPDAGEGGGECAEAPYPLVVISHGFGSNGERTRPHAERLAAAGIAACSYSFCGAFEGASDGSPLERSVLTEAADLHAVLDGLMARPEIDASRVVLLGLSEGGFVSTLVASQRPADIFAMALIYPAYCIPDDARALIAAGGGVVPASMDVMGHTIGGVYLRNAAAVDIFAAMPRYTGPVFIVHGTADEIVPIEYSRRAVQTFANARLTEVEGAGHGMRHEKGPLMASLCDGFLQELLG